MAKDCLSLAPFEHAYKWEGKQWLLDLKLAF